ncbi:E3 ubiquitin-protein ligase rfwd3.L-like [Haematobia irritans]|uniref:E3 ubiquitin-protein ligase rfwd3.L-like n=1 Tax=Haematobia irritans TaxID=7368 RepID=UPI003F4F9262
MENDHDYVASGGSSSSPPPINVVRSRRNIMRLNSDHNYVFAPVSSGSSNATFSGNTRSTDEDIFLDDDDDEDDGDGLNSEAGGQSDAALSQISENSSIPTLGPPSSEGESNGNSETDAVDDVSNSNSNVPSLDGESDTNSSEATRSVAAITSSGSENQLPPAEGETVPSQVEPPRADVSVINLETPSPPKKRKRLSLEANSKAGTPKVKSKEGEEDDDEDDGLTCPICLDNWEMSGEHRLSSLKCGHLFGESCIRRWLQESARQSGLKVCPQCKTKAHPKDIRYLYAKRLRAIDRSEEHRMRDELNQERSKNQNLELELATMKMSFAQVNQKIKSLEADNESLKLMLRTGGGGASSGSNRLDGGKGYSNTFTYKMFMEKNIELSREPGCRVMKYADHHCALIVSQKSSQGLFPGYGLRFVDTPTFKPSNFLHTSLKMVRDISFSEDQQMLAVASMEQKAKLFDLRTLQPVSIFKPDEKPIWSCAIARKESEYYLYLGSQQGSTYIYDIRYPETFLDQHQTEGGPVIQIESVPESTTFPCGGFIVCKLTSLWFYENIPGGGVMATRLSVEGRLISMRYDSDNQTLLVQTRSCQRFIPARHILGRLVKVENIPVFDLSVTFFAHTNSPVMVRSTQIAVESNTLVAAYIQDKKLLSIYNASSEQCIQSLPVQEVVYDTCPVYVKNLTYLAALTETKCRLYKLTITN